jgi:tetraacyldisaccharide 4'-kinase
MNPPDFWRRDGILPRLLAPASALVAATTAHRVARPGWRAPVPVLCCGNAGVGGAGKTTVALDLAARLIGRGARPAFLTRGYRGRLQGPVRVQPAHTAADVGDEPLLLAAVAPTYTGADRAATARMALADDATVLVMDDGLQNPALEATIAFLVIDGGAGFGNGRVLPAGPLREPVREAARRCRAAILIGDDDTDACRKLPPALPVLRARLRQDATHLAGARVLAFAGIGRPQKFFATLAEAGVVLAGTRAFPDHHAYRAVELAALTRDAAAAGATLVTTPKDAVRLPPAFRAQVAVASVTLEWADEAALEQLLQEGV